MSSLHVQWSSTTVSGLTYSDSCFSQACMSVLRVFCVLLYGVLRTVVNTPDSTKGIGECVKKSALNTTAMYT